MIFFLAFFKRNQASFIFFTVYVNLFNTLLNMIRVFNFNVINSIAECSCEFEITKSFRNARINAKSIVGWLYAH